MGLLDMLLFIPGEERFFAFVDTLPYRREAMVAASMFIAMVAASMFIAMVAAIRDAS